MASNPKLKAPGVETIRARVLADVERFGLKAGQIFEAKKSVIEALFNSGAVDTHPDALAYATENGAEVVTQPTADADATAT